MPCPSNSRHGFCGVLSQLERRATSLSAAWEEYFGFFVDQLSRAEDWRSKGFICTLLDVGHAFYHYNRSVPRSQPRFVKRQAELWSSRQKETREKYPLFPWPSPESLFNHHGLRWLPQKVKDYIQTRDIIDVGASIGDSLTVLDEYTERRVVSYELIPGTVEIAKKAAARLDPKKHLIVLSGLADKTGLAHVPQEGSGTSGLHQRGNAAVPITTIDLESKRLNLSVGVIKADVEGVEPQVLLGALETIKRDQPVITMSIYHGLEFLDLPKLLTTLGYNLRFGFGTHLWHLHWEMYCIGIPPLFSRSDLREENDSYDQGRCAEFDLP